MKNTFCLYPIGLVNIMCGFGVQEMKSAEVSSKIYRSGCIQSITLHVEQNLTLVGGIALGVALSQLLGWYQGKNLSFFCSFIIRKYCMYPFLTFASMCTPNIIYYWEIEIMAARSIYLSLLCSYFHFILLIFLAFFSSVAFTNIGRADREPKRSVAILIWSKEKRKDKDT